jgi:2'-hydroxyisoflavone reductase
LVIGGTQFVGRHVVEALLAEGHEVTLFHRGQTNPELFAQAEHRLGDRDHDLSSLAQGSWDATVDSSAYFPRQVRALAQALGGRGGRYVHISSVSAYAEPLGPGLTEDGLLAELDDPTIEVVNGSTYGGLKALCERAAHQCFGEGAATGDGRATPRTPLSIVRPTYVAGPHDHTGRFTWWVQRVAKGGRVLAPGPSDNPFQVIDARDLAAFVVLLARGGAAGVFHAVSPAPPFSFGDFLSTVVDEVGPPGTELVWVGAQALAEAGASGAELPLWAGLEPGRDISALDPSRAFRAGLRARPLALTVRETHQAELVKSTPVGAAIGLSPERERQLLALVP